MAVKKSVKKNEEVMVETPEVKVDDVKVEKSVDEAPEVTVDTTVADENKIPKDKNQRVKMREDAKFNFGGEKYNLKKGQCYNVPVAVKMHLNRIGVLLPL